MAYGVALDVDDPMRLVYFERWADREATRTHLRLPASRGFGKALAARLAALPTLLMCGATEGPMA